MNYQITFDPNGGDLGRADIRPVQPLEFIIIVPHVANILEGLYLSGDSKLPYRYAFEFPTHARQLAEIAMTGMKLPPHVKFYECDGLKLFAIRGASGGVVSGYVCYLITEEHI